MSPEAGIDIVQGSWLMIVFALWKSCNCSLVKLTWRVEIWWQLTFTFLGRATASLESLQHSLLIWTLPSLGSRNVRNLVVFWQVHHALNIEHFQEGHDNELLSYRLMDFQLGSQWFRGDTSPLRGGTIFTLFSLTEDWNENSKTHETWIQPSVVG